MHLLDQFEYPLPKLSLNVENIYIETSGSLEGSFVITNTGGGFLSGIITSNLSSINFSPIEFSGKDIDITYVVNLSTYKPGDIIRTSAVIMSNGGEAILPVEIKVIPPAIETKDGDKITSLKSFMDYAKNNPVASRSLFMSRQFMVWLFSLGYEYMDAYETFTKDPNKERALDNFFIISRLKKKTSLTILDKNIEIKIKPYEKELITGNIILKKSTWGYVENHISIKNNSPWIELEKERLVGADFDENDIAQIYYKIDPAKIDAKHLFDEIAFSKDMKETVKISVKKEAYFSAKISKECFQFEDTGNLILFNNTGGDITVEIISRDNFVKFEGKKYFISKYAEIPFQIKIPTLLMAQLSIKRQPVITAEIYVKTNFENIVFNKTLSLLVGDLS